MALSITTLGILDLIATFSINENQQNITQQKHNVIICDNQHNDTQHTGLNCDIQHKRQLAKQHSAIAYWT